MARPRKAEDRRVDNRSDRGNRPELRLIEGVPAPDCPAGVLKSTRERWDRFWISEQSRLVGGAMVDVIIRWALLWDEWERAHQAVKKSPMVDGSQGQPVAHPLISRMSSLETELRQLEDRLGLSPRSAVNLGLGLGQMRKTLDDLNRDLSIEVADDLDTRAVGGSVD